MQANQTPALVPLPFATNGLRNVIPEASQAGVTPGAASFNDGFPPMTMQPKTQGGMPPDGKDFNGILYDLSQTVRWVQAGGPFSYNAPFATDPNVGGYPKGAVLARADYSGFWFNQADNNTTNPDATDGSARNWIALNADWNAASGPGEILNKPAVQAPLGFTPVEQGNGIGQQNNKVYVGWSGTNLKATVDTTDLGNFVFSQSGGLIPVGAGLPYFGGTVPTGFLLCNGAAVSRTTYSALYAAIGTIYGAGDGSTTFNLPDSRGVVLRGFDNGRGLDSGRTLGSYQADSYASHAHGVNDPSHAHGVADPGHGHGVSDPGHSHSQINISGSGIGGNYFGNGTNNFSGGGSGMFGWGGTPFPTSVAGSNIGIAGAGTGIGIYGSATGISIQASGSPETRSKNLAVNFIIKY